jgi:outer membrane autotransporter protein
MMLKAAALAAALAPGFTCLSAAPSFWPEDDQVPVTAENSETVTLDASAVPSEARLNSKLTGNGEFVFTGRPGQAVFIENTNNDYRGDTTIDNVEISILTDNAFGSKAGLTLINGAKATLPGRVQTVVALNFEAGTEYSAAELLVEEGGYANGLVNVSIVTNEGTVRGSGEWHTDRIINTGKFNATSFFGDVENSGDFTATNVVGDKIRNSGTFTANTVTGTVTNSNRFTATGTLTGDFTNSGTSAVATLRDVTGSVTNRGGTIHLGGNASWGRFDNTGGYIDFLSAGQELRIASLNADTGNFGRIKLNINLLDLAGSDRIIVAGAITGRHMVELGLADNFDVNAVTRTSGNFPYIAVGSHGGESVSGTLRNVGPYDFVLTWDDSKSGYVLRAVEETFSPTAQAAINTSGAISIAWFSQLDSLTKRLGDLRLPSGKGLPPFDADTAFWVRGFGQKTKAKLRERNVSDFHEYQTGADVGFDHAFSLDTDNQGYLGVFTGYLYARRNFHDGYGSRGDTDALSFGAYATWINKNGWYADGVIKGQYFRSDYDALNDHGKFDNYGFGASFEFGRRIDLSGGMFLEPDVQFAYAHIFSESYTTKARMRVNAGDSDIYRFAAAVRLGQVFETGRMGLLQPYLSIGVEQQFSDGGSVRMANERITPDTDGTRAVVGAGVIWQPSASRQFHLDYEASFGKRYQKPWGINIGFRQRF